MICKKRLFLIQSRSKTRLNVFVGGRIAVRRAMKKLNVSNNYVKSPILTNQHGAPTFPVSHIIGSISHKDLLAVAVVKLDSSASSSGSNSSIGVDIERCTNKSSDRLFARILTEREQSQVANTSQQLLAPTRLLSPDLSSTRPLTVTAVTPAEQVMLHFSFKEAVFKALHPTCLRPIGFLEAEIYPRYTHISSPVNESTPTCDLGTVGIGFALKDGEAFEAVGHFERVLLGDAAYFLTVVSARRTS